MVTNFVEIIYLRWKRSSKKIYIFRIFRFVSSLKLFFTINRRPHISYEISKILQDLFLKWKFKRCKHISNALKFSFGKYSVDNLIDLLLRDRQDGGFFRREKGNFIHNEAIRKDRGSGIGSGTVRAFLPVDFLEERLVCGHLEFMRGCLPPGKCYARVITYILEGRESRTGRPLAAFNHHYTLARFLRLLAP